MASRRIFLIPNQPLTKPRRPETMVAPLPLFTTWSFQLETCPSIVPHMYPASSLLPLRVVYKAVTHDMGTTRPTVSAPAFYALIFKATCGSLHNMSVPSGKHPCLIALVRFFRPCLLAFFLPVEPSLSPQA